jgi:hypothetical protein
VDETKITVSKDGRGLFQRMIDTWTCLGGSLAFSTHLPMYKEEKIGFEPNKMYFFQNSNCLSMGQLLRFDPVTDYQRKYWHTFGKEKLVHNSSLSNSMNVPTRILQNYLILFAASSVARYRPIFWSSVLSGDTNGNASVAMAYRKALLNFSEYGINSMSLLRQLSIVISDVIEGKFQLKKHP